VHSTKGQCFLVQTISGTSFEFDLSLTGIHIFSTERCGDIYEGSFLLLYHRNDKESCKPKDDETEETQALDETMKFFLHKAKQCFRLVLSIVRIISQTDSVFKTCCHQSDSFLSFQHISLLLSHSHLTLSHSLSVNLLKFTQFVGALSTLQQKPSTKNLQLWVILGNAKINRKIVENQSNNFAFQKTKSFFSKGDDKFYTLKCYSVLNIMFLRLRNVG
jgi:hypothetical protein